MDAVTGLGNTSSAAGTLSNGGLNDTNVDDFLRLMIAELQNQDPLDPMDNSEMVGQLNEIRSIGATDKLTDTLDSVLIGQNLATASGLIGKDVSALTDDGENIEGLVERVTVESSGDDGERTIRVHIGNHEIALANVRAIQTPVVAEGGSTGN